MLKLTPRLEMAAGMVRRGNTVVDIGTDHAYLPAYLVLNRICPNAIACDVKEGPLLNAAKTVAKYALGDKIELRLSDGLKAIKKGEAQDIVMCGMGGNLIEDILTPAEWLNDKKYRLIIQPQSHSEDVRRFLDINGFEILNETVCKDSGKLYFALCAEYDGHKPDKNETQYFFGRLPECENEFATNLIENILKRLKLKANSIKGYSDKKNEYEKLYAVISQAEDFVK
ncbi:MAG: class I SAM-dependent methyltransferase [Clostridiales bacterium]|nr:class I SAM-dependent methyltransferase [Clostridiales bacterium]